MIATSLIVEGSNHLTTSCCPTSKYDNKDLVAVSTGLNVPLEKFLIRYFDCVLDIT